jgi:hypothetical protein
MGAVAVVDGTATDGGGPSRCRSGTTGNAASSGASDVVHGADPGHGEPGASGAVAGTGPAGEEAGTSVASRAGGPARVGLSAGADRGIGTWFVLGTREADAESSTCCCTHETKTGNGKQVGEYQYQD